MVSIVFLREPVYHTGMLELSTALKALTFRCEWVEWVSRDQDLKLKPTVLDGSVA